MSNCTAFTASVGVDDEVVSTRGSIVFQVYLDGVVAYDSGTMTGATATRAVSVNTTGKTALRLVVAVGSGGRLRPRRLGRRQADLRERGPVDTTPPTVTSSTPANGATGQPTGTAPTAVFSEAIDQATLTTTTFSVTDQTTAAAVAGSVGYDGAEPAGDLHADLGARRRPDLPGPRPRRRHRCRRRRRQPPRRGRDLDVHHGGGAGHHAADGHRRSRRPTARPGQSTSTAPTATFSEAINAATLDDHDLQPDRPDDPRRGGRHRSATTAPPGSPRSPRAPPWWPAGPTLPASWAARPASPTSPATASPRTSPGPSPRPRSSTPRRRPSPASRPRTGRPANRPARPRRPPSPRRSTRPRSRPRPSA